MRPRATTGRPLPPASPCRGGGTAQAVTEEKASPCRGGGTAQAVTEGLFVNLHTPQSASLTAPLQGSLARKKAAHRTVRRIREMIQLFLTFMNRLSTNRETSSGRNA